MASYDKVSKRLDKSGNLTDRNELDIIEHELKYERSSWETHITDIANYVRPRRLRINLSDTNRGDRKNTKIYDSTATKASDILSAGMMGGLTNPAKKWFRLTTKDRELSKIESVKSWLFETEENMFNLLSRSNLYTTLPPVYSDLADFSTGVMLVEEDYESVVKFTSVPWGEYYIATNERGDVRTYMREYQMTVRQIVDKFARKDAKNRVTSWKNISDIVKTEWDQKRFETQIDVIHLIRQNPNYDPNKKESKYKLYQSVYYETGGANYRTTLNRSYGQSLNDFQTHLRESGFDYFPLLAPRWKTVGTDAYGSDGPGMISLGDIKQLQKGEKKILQAIEKLVDPPVKAPPELMEATVNALPGGVTFVSELNTGNGLSALYQVNPRVQELEFKQEQVRKRINENYFKDLFLLFIGSDRRDITATEIERRQEEKLVVLGPVLQQVNDDLLDPLIDITFHIMMKRGLISPPPQELQGKQIDVEYVSIMAQAQKLANVGLIERFVAFVGNVGGAVPEALDNVNIDRIISEYGETIGVPPHLIRPENEISEIRFQRQQQIAAQQQLAALREGAQVTKDLGKSETNEDNLLGQLIQ